MVCIGYDSVGKVGAIADYCERHAIDKVVVFAPERFSETLHPMQELVTYTELIQYKFFYRLIQEIDGNTLVVVNECLRTQNRNDLTYNCLRHLINQSGHQIVFQYLPIINSKEDFMVLFDFATQSRWKRNHFDRSLFHETEIRIRPISFSIDGIEHTADNQLKSKYAKEKARLFKDLGQKDPNTIPRNLYLLGGRTKMAGVAPKGLYVGRNKRFPIENLTTYRDVKAPGAYTIFELPFDFIDFTDFLFVSKQAFIPIMTTDLPVDRWYMQRFTEWKNRLDEAYSSIQ